MTKKTYQERATLYQDPEWRSRCDMCIREQAHIHAQEDAPHKADMKALAMGVISGHIMDIEAVMASVVNWPGAETTITDDEALKGVVNNVWPLVASARYPGAVELMNQIALSRMPPQPQPRSQTVVMPPAPPPLPQTKDDTPCEDCP